MYAGSNPASGNSGIAKRLSNRKLKVRILHVFLDTLTQLVECCTVMQLRVKPFRSVHS